MRTFAMSAGFPIMPPTKPEIATAGIKMDKLGGAFFDEVRSLTVSYIENRIDPYVTAELSALRASSPSYFLPSRRLSSPAESFG
jgi:hypothetical protein